MNKIAEQVLVASGNLPVFPSGQPVWVAPSGKKSPTLRVLPGQIVIYDPTTNLSLGPGATTETNPAIKIAVVFLKQVAARRISFWVLPEKLSTDALLTR
jgi:hypothetical protein